MRHTHFEWKHVLIYAEIKFNAHCICIINKNNIFKMQIREKSKNVQIYFEGLLFGFRGHNVKREGYNLKINVNRKLISFRLDRWFQSYSV